MVPALRWPPTSARPAWRTGISARTLRALIQFQFGARRQVLISIDLRRGRRGLELEGLSHRLQGPAQTGHINMAHTVLNHIRRDEHIVERHLDARLLNFAVDERVTFLE